MKKSLPKVLKTCLLFDTKLKLLIHTAITFLKSLREYPVMSESNSSLEESNSPNISKVLMLIFGFGVDQLKSLNGD